MLLTPTELERLTIYTAAEIARKRRAKGLLLNYPEAAALISDEMIEGAREGRTVAELIGAGSRILTTDDVMAGVAEMMPMLQVEGTFPDGTKLVTVHEPIRPGKKKIEHPVEPGAILPKEGEIELNAGRNRTKLSVRNTGDRPIQVGSHFHFFEANKQLDFDRANAFGMHLDIASGTAVRFEPGDTIDVELVAFGGEGEIRGLNGLTEGSTRSDKVKEAALERARAAGFKGA
jgi:urease subunit gamma/beta